jgi:hypothetical protein
MLVPQNAVVRNSGGIAGTCSCTGSFLLRITFSPAKKQAQIMKTFLQAAGGKRIFACKASGCRL